MMDKELHRYVYRGPIKWILETVGGRNAVAKAYARLRWMGVDDRWSTTLGGASALFAVSNFKEFHRLLYHSGERDVIVDVIGSHSPESTFMDIGANIGIYTCLVGDTLDGGSVVALEPHPKNYRRLEENMRLNGTPGSAFDVAVFDDTGERSFKVKSDNTGEGHGQVDIDGSGNTVRTVRGDDLYPEYISEIPETIKIDVEGAEMQVLSGMRELLIADDCKRIYIEVHPEHLQTYGWQAPNVEEFLRELGFAIVRQFDFDSESYTLKAVANADVGGLQSLAA